MASPEVELQIPVLVARVVAGGRVSAREARPEPGTDSGLPKEPGVSPEIGNKLTQFSSQEGFCTADVPIFQSSLDGGTMVTRLLRAAQQQNPTEEKVPPDAELRWQQTLPPPSTLPQSPVSETADQVCFSCGRLSHGVS